MTSPVDIRPDHLAIVQSILSEHLAAGVKAWAFESRASWSTKDSSYLSLALEGATKLSHRVLDSLEDAFEDSEPPTRLITGISKGSEALSSELWNRTECPSP